MTKKVAILVDGNFFIRQHFAYFKKTYETTTPKEIAKCIQTHCLKHIKKGEEELYRVFYYDCKPLDKKVHYPISNTALDLSKTPICIFKTQFYKELVSTPCFALRLGSLNEKDSYWKLRDRKKYADLIKGKISHKDLSDEDFVYYAKQKGVDMKIGIDIASLALKKLVDKIVLISGDSDFVPAAKLARVEGLHFVLDPMNMGQYIKEDLREHIDWLTTTLPKRQS
ncbi:helicase [Helicobacter sp. MIT 00-7814]|uniref:NYN domain-containing protein n=1 Tax=unclassified Helicobacter TaxID=2593540 RepID=UPI000E1E617F|nr:MULTISPECIES: NYN domain-containing protein [unclassified Helicobacter]RDU51358.1 helicase [Helicobacter sp. MIT 99-10781]RDU51425.1 helicase [Helicobacter sp. MIT 00-7814]